MQNAILNEKRLAEAQAGWAAPTPPSPGGQIWAPPTTPPGRSDGADHRRSGVDVAAGR